ncbi:MAG: polysaccharide deacetylase family protein, partial [Christensenellales bacterium]
MRKFTKIMAMLLAVLLLVGIMPPKAQAAGSTKLIALTFDDGPSAANTGRLLDGLKARGAHVSFFMTGQNAKRNPSLVKRAYEEGHQICSHTYDHALLTKLSNSEIRSQLDKTNKILDDAIGYDLAYSLRPPYGGYNDRVLSTANTPCYYWSVDTRDWESRNANAAYNMFMKYAKDGSIVLMHDLYGTTVTAALNAIDTLQKQGFEFVTINELQVRRGITPMAGKIYFDIYPSSHGTDKPLSNPAISYQQTDGGKKVIIKGDSRARIIYTTDGTDPTPEHGYRYKGAFSVKDKTTVKAISVVNWNGFKSGIVSKKISYTTLATPKLTAADGKITLTGITSGANYYYTTNGKIPTSSSARYTGNFTAVPDTVYTVKGIGGGYYSSASVWATYGSSGKLYTDMRPGIWYYAAADRAVGEGMLELVGTKLAPHTAVTRAQLVTMLYRMSGSPSASGDMPFDDVPESAKYYEAVK